MKIHYALERNSDRSRPLVLAIGFFDGVHLGHRAILSALLRLRRPGFRAAVLTFVNHPATHLRPEQVPPLITTTEERIDLLAETGIDELYMVPFDATVASLDARRFLEEIIVEGLSVKALVVGENFRFGNGRRGDTMLAREVLSERGIELHALEPVFDQGERVSSTRIRAALERGDFATVNRLLGQAWSLRGRVVLGRGRGHELGFPTANLATPPGKMLPRDGIYAVVARYDGRDYRGLASLGDNPTFGAGAKTFEVWMRDFQRTIYGEELLLRDFAFVREQRTFGTVEELVAQMHEDATHVGFPSFTVT